LFSNQSTIYPVTTPQPQFNQPGINNNRKVALTDAWAISPRYVNDLRISYSRFLQQIATPAQFDSYNTYHLDDLNNLTIGPNDTQRNLENEYQIVDNQTFQLSRHTLKWGAEYRHYISPTFFLSRSHGEYDYPRTQDLVNDIVPGNAGNTLRGAGSPLFSQNQNSFYWFAQDDFKVTPRLTLNLGLRYELNHQPVDMNMQAASLDPVARQLVVLSDLSRALRDEERQAWQRLIRVMGHELNNSLAPIQSVAQSLESGLQSLASGPEEAQGGPSAELLDDMRQGFGIIRSRTEALGRFMAAYSRLARLPAPKLAPVDVRPWITRVVKLETRVKVKLEEGPDVVIAGDADQLEHLLINLVHNAADAVLESGKCASVGWARQDSQLHVWVIDDGLGIQNPANVFVPFFTTKKGGTGIGLALSRQIAEGHGGTLTLENRKDGRGAEARLKLPL